MQCSGINITKVPFDYFLKQANIITESYITVLAKSDSMQI